MIVWCSVFGTLTSIAALRSNRSLSSHIDESALAGSRASQTSPTNDLELPPGLSQPPAGVFNKQVSGDDQRRELTDSGGGGGIVFNRVGLP